MIIMSEQEEIQKQFKEIVIARLETLNPNSKILLMSGKEPISVKDMLEAVRENSEFGKKIVEVQYAYLKMLTSGEIDK